MGLADMYCDGKGCSKDTRKAIELCEKAATFNSHNDQNMIGYYYMNGIGVDRDFKEAERWFRMAILDGSDEAIRNLGFLYLIKSEKDENGEE